MKMKNLSIVSSLLLGIAAPSFALADGRYHNSGQHSYDRGARYQHGEPYRRSDYHGRDYGHSYYDHDHGYYGHHDYDDHHHSHSSFLFSFGFGSYYPFYGGPAYYYEPVYVAPAPVYVAPPVTYYSPSYYYASSCYSRPSSYYYSEARYYYGR